MKIIPISQSSVKERIIDTIDQLRQRKARPDLERISHMLERKHGLKASETEGYLEKLVDSGDVIKVEYKGSTSYRNGAKWKKHHMGGQVLNSREVSDKVVDAVRSLIATNPGDAKQGLSLKDIETYLVKEKGETHLLKETLATALNREADSGKIRKNSNGNYWSTLKRGSKPDSSVNQATKPKTAVKRALTDTGGQPTNKVAKLTQSPKNAKPTMVSDATEVASPKRGRPVSKRKRIKKNHGPDFESYDPAVSEKRMCDFCLATDKKQNGQKEELLVCTDCNAKAHPSCMDYSEGLARRARRSPWQCIDCKTCFICQDAGDPDAMLFCDACDKGYHMKCHRPPVSEKPKGKWACTQCFKEGVTFNENGPIAIKADRVHKEPLTVQIDTNLSPDRAPTLEPMTGTSCLPTPCDSPVTEGSGISLDGSHGKNNSIRQEPSDRPSSSKLKVENAGKWSADDVVAHFTYLGYGEQADGFKEQEIDGQSLLLLRRNDVLTGLTFKLGPALKIYNHVVNIQTDALTL